MFEIREITAAETWPLRQNVMWPDKPVEFVILPDDEAGFHYGLFEKEYLVSVISLFKNGCEGRFRKFATNQEFQRMGYGSELLKYLINQAKLLNINTLWCDARASAIGFYERFGMKVTTDIVRKSGIDYVKMEVILNQ